MISLIFGSLYHKFYKIIARSYLLSIVIDRLIGIGRCKIVLIRKPPLAGGDQGEGFLDGD